MKLPAILLRCALVAATLAAGAALAQDAKKALVIEVALKDGKFASGKDNTVRVKRGDQVELRVSSPDRAIDLHLHGYDIEAKAAPQAPAVIKFAASITGRFPVSEHAHGKTHHHRAVLYLEVRP